MRILPWLEPVYTADQMRAIDSWAIEVKGTPSLDLMERAGSAVADCVRELAPCEAVRIVCGKGNNGGDGLVCGRLLMDATKDVEALLLYPGEQFTGDARVNLERYQEHGGRLKEIEDAKELKQALAGVDVIVDAIFGTGFTGEPSGLTAEAIKLINAAKSRVVAVDVPSGVNASTGEVSGVAVQAALTASFHAGKVGLWVNPGKKLAGEVTVADIGIPQQREGERDLPGGEVGLSGPGLLRLYPKRAADSSKFTSGALVVIGGSTGLTGAVCMAAEAAMRCGAGYVQTVVPASLNPIFEEKLLEVMSLPAPDLSGHLTPDAAKAALKASARADATVLGPGLGRDGDTYALARELVPSIETPLLVDADGLNALVGSLELAAERGAETVLTPHAGELARLLDVGSDEVNRYRLRYVREAAERCQGVVVLKGDDTIVASVSGHVTINRRSTPALATAGTGDVLAGVIGALLAKGITAFEAAALGVYLHAEAAIKAASRVGTDGLIASDVIDALPLALP